MFKEKVDRVKESAAKLESPRLPESGFASNDDETGPPRLKPPTATAEGTDLLDLTNAKAPEVKIPGTDYSVDALVALLLETTGHSPTQLVGAVTLTPTRAAIGLKWGKYSHLVVRSIEEEPSVAIGTLMDEAVEVFLEDQEPCDLEAYYFGRHDDRCQLAARRCA
jgi:hypothetical protein